MSEFRGVVRNSFPESWVPVVDLAVDLTQDWAENGTVDGVENGTADGTENGAANGTVDGTVARDLLNCDPYYKLISLLQSILLVMVLIHY